jgi:hypothetical protein
MATEPIMHKRTDHRIPIHLPCGILPRSRPLLILGALLLSQCAHASPGAKEQPATEICREASDSGPAGVVKALYRAYPFESDKVPENEPMDVLLRYFDEEFAALLVADRDCTERTGDLCKLTASLLYAAQDASIKDLRVCELEVKHEWVEVRFLNFGRPKVVFFKVKETRGGWRIADIRYGADGTVAKMLMEP